MGTRRSGDQTPGSQPLFLYFAPRAPAMGAKKQQVWDGHRRDACRTLRSVDDQVGRIVDELSQSGRLDNTLISFAPDNGMLFGEHPGTTTPVLASDMDYAERIMDAAGVPFPAGYATDGQSLLPLVTGSGPVAKERILIEHGGGVAVPAYCGVRVQTWTYARYATGEEELYDLTTDPWETRNLAADPGSAAQTARLRALAKRMCVPTPPGFSW
jgi:arylsulfatase A-like enzyme